VELHGLAKILIVLGGQFRLIINGNSEEGGLFPLAGRLAPFLKVTGIIIGNQMEESERRRVHDLCQNKKIRLYSTTYSDSLYEIIIKPYLNMSHDAFLHVKKEGKYQLITTHYSCKLQADQPRDQP
jgi:hypothetical protein